MAKGFSLECHRHFTHTCFAGDVTLHIIQEVINEWSRISERNPGPYAYVFDYANASLNQLSESDAIFVSDIQIFDANDIKDRLLVGILPNRRDYSLACIWATHLHVSGTFPREQVFLFKEPIQAWKYLKQWSITCEK